MSIAMVEDRTEEQAMPVPSRIVNAMTVDLEDYFHVSVFDGVVPRDRWQHLERRVEFNTDRLLRIFDDEGVKATFFVLGCVAKDLPQLIARIAAAGHEVASHGYAHRLIYDQTVDEFRDDVRRSKDLLESGAGQSVEGFRAPSYSIVPQTLWALDVLIEEGFRYDASIFPIRHDRYGIPLSPRHPYMLTRQAGSIVEAPASTVRIGSTNLPIAGGGYFRILPYGWTRWGIAHLNRREKQPAIFYLHPWEIDPEQPRLQAGFVSRFRHYRNLDRTESRLRRLVHDFHFGCLRTVLSTVPAHSGAQVMTPLPYHW